MANLSGENGLDATMLVQPSGGYNYGGYPIAMPFYGGNYGGFGGGNGIFGGDFGAIIALFFFAMMFGGFGGGWGMGGFGGFGGGYEFPWLLASNANNQNATQAGFNNAALTTQLDGIRSDVNRGFGDTQLGIAGVNQNICQSTGQIHNALCQGFAGTTAAVTGAQNAITQQMYTNQIADMERSYAAQTANSQGFNNVNAGLADTKYTIATEACATRQTDTQNTQNIINTVNTGIQSLKDQLCAYRDAQKDDTIANLRQELMFSRGQASQVEQTAQLLANNNAQTALFQQGLNNEVDALYTRLQNCPVNTVPVYGNQRIFTCPQQYSPCGCNGGNFQ